MRRALLPCSCSAALRGGSSSPVRRRIGKRRPGAASPSPSLQPRYAHKVSAGRFRGTLSYQLNVTNLFDDDGIIPQRFSSTPDFIVPGGRGVGYRRFDFVEPRAIRFTTRYSY